MTRNAVVFGTGSFAEVVDFYLMHDSDYDVVAFTSTAPERDKASMLGRPVVPFDSVSHQYPPATHEMFVAVGYAEMNRVRERFCGEARALGYRLLSYVCSKATSWGDAHLGDNVFVFEDNTIQPFVSIGDGTILWSGNHIGHHSTLGRYCFITSHVVVSGHCHVGDRTFIGVNATVADSTKVAEENLIGASAFIQKSTQRGEVWVGARANVLSKPSSEFFR